ncbi:hypothetical protein SAMN04488040_2257 [Sulfitobacter marinus]|uniref:Uncharacterized protein n=1 Tax=Sulfitobacter marinus TaxID=394264 RepID=A0A1I6TH66_9RHOB|nr:hypothetical protein [Sulfitobacter marinus]SFS88468.1 hypothetical protein SAMN04488040_2257 [Sulfitobacter marinus]
MSTLKLTKTHMLEGIWQGNITGSGESKPDIAVTHDNADVPDFKLTKADAADRWSLTIPVPASAIADGIQVIVVTDNETGQKIGDVVIIGDEVTNIDQRAELELLRAELEMLKRAFRRHCIETA